MPVSRKRKKARKPAPAKRVQNHIVSVPAPQPALIDELLTARSELDAGRRVAAAGPARDLVAGIAEFAPGRTGAEVEDELCVRLGPLLAEMEGRTGVEDYISADLFAEVLLGVVIEQATEGTLGHAVLAAVAGIVPWTPRLVEVPPQFPGGENLLADRPLAGEVLWTRDAYGSRVGVLAPFDAEGTVRWYLWDVDACTFKPFTVHSGFYANPEAALDAWRAGVGATTAAGAQWSPADIATIGDVVPQFEGPLRFGGEHAAQFAEYYRARRLAGTLLELDGSGVTTNPPVGRETAAREFADYLTGRGIVAADDVGDVAEALAESWGDAESDTFFATCSPHRVAAMTVHIREYYDDEFGPTVLTAMPAWVDWLGERLGTPAELIERCRPYAHGEWHPGLGTDQRRPDYQARLIE
ncbi:hypothetical protein [Actinoplanes sp. NPDC051851]|uniref:hypothetical protein n=1 Tax=Actinoplanes sp. NPDC051851 TaxID=3154753 RepID=UPI003431D207